MCITILKKLNVLNKNILIESCLRYDDILLILIFDKSSMGQTLVMCLMFHSQSYDKLCAC
jgi:hypothetical protein